MDYSFSQLLFSQEQFSQTQNTQRCALCNSTDFYKRDGHYLCANCQTQNDDLGRCDEYEDQFDPKTRTRKTKIRKEKEEKEIIGWTSWELYNLVLIGITDELITIGANPKIKLTVLQLWTYYLSKLEVAFTSKTRKCVPKMARRYHKRDAQIIYGIVQQKKKKKRKQKTSATSASSLSFVSETSNSTKELNRSKRLLVASEYDKYMQSQASSDTDFSQGLYSLKSSISQGSTNTMRIRFSKRAKLETKKVKALSLKVPRFKRHSYKKKHVTSQYAMGPDIVTPLKLWSIIYLALRIHDEDIYLSDMLRFSREFHLSYYKLDHLLPPEVLLNKSDVNLLTQTTDITHKGFRKAAASIAKFLNVNEFAQPNFLGLINRYCQDLGLPRGISLYAERLFLSSPSVMDFTAKSPLIPNYEGRAMAYVIVVLKTLFSLDDITEKEISRIAEKFNRIAQEKDAMASKLFSFCEWQRYIECRKNILATIHFPSKIKYDPERAGLSHLYLRFTMMKKRDGEPPEITDHTHILPQNIVHALAQSIDQLNNVTIPMNVMEEFTPSLTPLRSYVTELLENGFYDIPSMMRMNFEETKVGYLTKLDTLYDLASQCGIKLEVVDHSLHYLEKIVPPFEQPRMPTPTELSEPCRVEVPTSSKNIIKEQNKNLLDYTYRNRPCKIKVNYENLKHYTTICNKIPEIDETLDFEENSAFDQILPNGQLNISQDSDSEDENSLNEIEKEGIERADNRGLLNAQSAYNVKLYSHEKESLLVVRKPKEKYDPCRDEKGKFVKATARNIRENNEKVQKKEFKRIISVPSDESSSDEYVPKMHRKKRKSKKENQENHDQDDSENDVVEIPSKFFEISDSDISILDEYNVTRQPDLNNISIDDNETLFRPFRNYWMYHCIFSRVKGKNFDLFEKELPQNFLWLLNECADIVEMTTEDLYEEVCLVESLHLNILKSKKSKGDSDYEFHDCTSKSYLNNILNKW